MLSNLPAPTAYIIVYQNVGKTFLKLELTKYPNILLIIFAYLEQHRRACKHRKTQKIILISHHSLLSQWKLVLSLQKLGLLADR